MSKARLVWVRTIGLAVFTLVLAIANALPIVYIENVIPNPPPCGEYVSEQWVPEEGCRDRKLRLPCNDGTPGFYNKNYLIQRTRIDKYYTNGTRHLCTAWNEVAGRCCNSISEPPCPDSNCHL